LQKIGGTTVWAIFHKLIWLSRINMFFNYTETSLMWGYFFRDIKYAISFDKQNGLGHLLGDFIKNSSGHPAPFIESRDKE
jgi:hypothetical protein